MVIHLPLCFGTYFSHTGCDDFLKISRGRFSSYWPTTPPFFFWPLLCGGWGWCLSLSSPLPSVAVAVVVIVLVLVSLFLLFAFVSVFLPSPETFLPSSGARLHLP